MAELRKKTHSILLSSGGKMISIELFDARLWPDQSSIEGLFRVRIDGKWYSPNGKYTFFHFGAVGNIVTQLMAEHDLIEEESVPDIQANQRVRVHIGDCLEGLPISSELGWSISPPFRAVDGRWYIFVKIATGTIKVPVHDVEIIKNTC